MTTAKGSVRVTDALVTGVAGRLPWLEVGRRVDGIEGHVRMRWSVRAGTALGTASPWIQTIEDASVLRVGQVTIGVSISAIAVSDEGKTSGTRSGTARSDGARTDSVEGDEIAGEFRTSPGSRNVLAVVGTEGEPLHIPTPENVDRGIDRTTANWRSWSREFSYDGPWAAAVQRSTLALKLLVYAPTGAIAAAATSSLPESPAGGKNWDYRFAWVRDLAYMVNALVRFGLREETHAALSWLLQTITANGPDLHIFYGLDGDVPDGVQQYDVPGWHGIGPVVSGNAAQNQLQLGVFGDLLGVARAYVDAGNVLDTETGRLLSAAADRACDEWRSKDSGMWELKRLDHYTSSKMGVWQALSAAIHLAEVGQLIGNVERWREEIGRIRRWIDDNCWSEALGSYVMAAGGTDLDASVLLHAPSGFDRGDRMASTIEALVGRLGRGPLLYRYSGIENEEEPFVACSFWLVSALACVGRAAEAKSLMDELIRLSNDVGLYSEMISEEDGAFWGNLPQGLSHLGLINAAMTYEELN
jgi:GH15 family glucan-1,4-alpha-glucosidase